ncbi:hypothetical protein GALL_148420 [mine drainage metagenome]|uniref:Uncharacterized protein n=1 Tax=mine drainage metagenome TaxID=410659 RepID=A0A1J5SG94_9ZZZZ
MKPETARPEDPPGAAESSGKRPHGRLRRSVQARFIALLTAAIARLERLKRRAGGAEEEEYDARPHHPKATPLPQEPVEALPPRRHRLRNFLLVLGILVLTGLLGTGISYRVFSKMIRDQAAKIESQQQDITSYQLEEQQQADKIAGIMRMLDAERGRRQDAEKRLAELAAKAVEAAPKDKASAAEPAKERRSGTAKAIRSPRDATFKPTTAAKATSCTLVDGDVEALKRCLKGFDR